MSFLHPFPLQILQPELHEADSQAILQPSVHNELIRVADRPVSNLKDGILKF